MNKTKSIISEKEKILRAVNKSQKIEGIKTPLTLADLDKYEKLIRSHSKRK
jgi:hypothetical protein